MTQAVTSAKGAEIGEAVIQEFQTSLGGELLRPGDGQYDTARKVYNALIDKHPAMIVLCAGVADVIAAVNFARDNLLALAVRGGGHSIAGKAVCDGGLVIDLSRMKGIRVDPERRTVRAQGGVTWGELDRETQAFGLATTGGAVSTTGIAGLTLGGGIGWLNGKHGLSCDNLLSVDIVTADGRFLIASTTQNEDLFWGVRGGGGNFGAVTSFEYQLHPLGTVLGGMLIYPMAEAAKALRFYRDFIDTVPDELSVYAALLTAPPEPFVPTHLQGAPIVAFALCHAGPLEEGEKLIRPLREFGPPAVDLVAPMPYTALQSMLDGGNQPGFLNYWKAGFLTALSDDLLDTVVAHSVSAPSPITQVLFEHVHGAANRVAADATAFPHRDANYSFGIYSGWSDPQDSDRQIEWTREFWAAMQPFTTGAVYVNYLSEDESDRVGSAYGANYERLVALKNKYDPGNLFRLNQNLRPTARSQATPT